MRVGRFETREYVIAVGARQLRLLGPFDPNALLDDPDVEVRCNADGYLPYWATPWASAVVLAEYAIESSAPPPGPVLELGTGLGLAGIALALAGFRVIATDYDGEALAFVRENAARNGVKLADVRELDWRHPPAEQYAMIIASDCLYERRNHAPLAAMLAASLSADGFALFSDPGRAVAAEFPATLPASLKCESIPLRGRPVHGVDGEPTVFNGTLYRVTR